VEAHTPAATQGRRSSARFGAPSALRLIALSTCILAIFAGSPLLATEKTPARSVQDSDHDGLSDALESSLLARFSPAFMISSTDCSIMPAQFVAEMSKPTVRADDGTVYGQAFPRKDHPDQVELHYYHLWRSDCGQLGHALDAEHVAALIQLHGDANAAKALYWYAAAHEDTICDASQVAQAETLAAEDRGPAVWISNGKHGSFFSRDLCATGCGGDRCQQMQPLIVSEIVNVGEPAAPMQGIAWLLSPEWPLQQKLRRSDFTDPRLARADRSPKTDIVWANPSKRPAQAAILGVNAGLGGTATGAEAADTALATAQTDTSSALGSAKQHAAKALDQSSSNVWKALRRSAEKTGGLLAPKKTQP
jgi:hypothetical protein